MIAMILLWYIYLIVSLATCKESLIAADSAPDITLLSDVGDEYVDHICVAGENVIGNAINFITPITTGYHESTPVSQYIFEGKEFTDEFNCDFEETSDCANKWEPSGRVEQSGNNLLDPVLDERWEKFTTFSHNNIPMAHKLPEGNFKIGLSVRSKEAVSTVLCDNFSQCYWITFHRTNTTLRLCREVKIDKFNLEDSSCNTSSVINTTMKVSEKNWKHLAISKNDNTLDLHSFNKRKIKNNFNISDSFDFKRIYIHINIREGQKKVLWKIHRYKYLSLQKTETWQDLGPKLKPRNGSLCVFLYTAACENCKLYFKFRDQDEEQIYKYKSENSKQHWRYLRLVLLNADEEEYQLQFQAYATYSDFISQEFWYIDDVRQCHLEEIRVIKLRTPTSNKDEVSCVAFKHSEWKSSIIGSRVGTLGKKPCDNPMFIGNNCDISCASVLGASPSHEYCNKLIICGSSQNSEPSCFCSSGYYNSSCQEPCPAEFYGRNCHQVCDPCQGYCLKSTGLCPPGKKCQYMDDKVLGCKISGLLKNLKPPTLISKTLTTITVRPELPEKSNILYQIQYRYNQSKWMSHGKIREMSMLEETTLEGLFPFTYYNIRIVLFTGDKYASTDYVDHIFTSVETTCDKNASGIKYYKNLDIISESEKIIIEWSPICDAKLGFVLKYNKDNIYACSTPSHSSTPIEIIKKEYIIYNLIPNSNYSLEITVFDEDNLQLNERETRRITTMESDLPVLKSPPSIIQTTLTTFTVQFHRSDITKGETANQFEIQYRKKNNKGWTTGERNYVRKINTVTIEKLEMETLYQVRVVFYTTSSKSYDNCLPIREVQTKCEDTSKLTLIKNLEVTLNTREALVTWTPVCRNTFHIEVDCAGDSWCTTPNTDKSFGSLQYSYHIEGLIPFTKYEMKFSVTTDIKDEVNTTTFQTNAGVPPPVTELQVYSFDSEAILVRFKKPYPPHGELMTYEQTTRECWNWNGNFQDVYPSNSPINCTIWDGFQCLTISKSFNNFCYEIAIAAKNKYVIQSGKNEIVVISTSNKTEAPGNLKIKPVQNNDNNVEICWNHPNFTRGTIDSFQITVKETSSELIKKEIYEKNEKYTDVSSLRKKYCHKFLETFPLSSTYKISVKGVTRNGEGQEASKTIDTAPLQPMFDNNITLNERTNTTQKISIPAIKRSTLTYKSFMYVLVCGPTSKHGISKENLEDNLQKNLRSWSNCAGVLWVAAQLNASEQAIEFTVGDNNEPLRPDVNYTISVVVVNEYKNKYSYEKYSVITSAPEYPDDHTSFLYFLFLLLLLVPVIGFFVFRQYSKQDNTPGYETSLEEATVQNNNVPMRNMLNALSRNIQQRKSDDSKNECGEPLIDNISDDSVFTNIVKIENLSQYVKESLENGELERQHLLFPKGGTKPWEYGMMKANKLKNRYNNLTAYDHSRVILNKLPGDSFSDFINANYIDGYKKPKAYIATQGPKKTTVDDFWRMIWQEKVKCIVMLANLVEGNKVKCHQYWPEMDNIQEYSDISVTYIQSDIYADFEYRIFEAKCDEQTRKIQHFHFTSWPDHGVPQYPQSLVPFLRKILTVSTNAPIVVHCSAGVGRTGTIILSDICLRMAAVENHVDVLKYMHSIREQRANLVDNFGQYKLVHMVLLECLLAPETGLSCSNLASAVDDLVRRDGIKQQINYLKDTAWHSQVMMDPMELEAENVSKNRFPDIVPIARRFYISRYPYDDEFSDYINAVPVDGFRIKDQFIVTQTPLPHTVKDFWRMIYEQEVNVIVSLNEIIINDNTCCIFWPVQDGQYKPVPYLILNCQSIHNGSNFDIYNIQIENSDEENSIRFVCIIQYKNWKREQKVPNGTETLIGMLEEAQNLSRQGGPLVVTCFDGATASGLFVALSFLIEKMKLEQICDVCQAVRAVRINRPEFVTQQVQFEFLYQAALEYIASFETYSNFEGPRQN